MVTYNKYEPELKEKILRLYLEENRTKKSLTEVYNLGSSTLTYWLQQRHYRMMRELLVQRNLHYSNPTFFKYMKELGLRSIKRRKKPCC